jgi:hypothetical protein
MCSAYQGDRTIPLLQGIQHYKSPTLGEDSDTEDTRYTGLRLVEAKTTE